MSSNRDSFTPKMSDTAVQTGQCSPQQTLLSLKVIRDAKPQNAQLFETPIPHDPYDTVNGDKTFCGAQGEWAHVYNNSERSILPDLARYPLTDDIKNMADVIYNKMRPQTRRGKVRTQMIFYCVYCAHLELKREVNPVKLGKVFDLTPGQVQKCHSMFAPLQTGYFPPALTTTPLRYLPDYCRDLQLSQDAIEFINTLAQNVLRKDQTLNEENPQTVAAGILRYYVMITGIVVEDLQKLSEITGRSTVTIEAMCRRISNVDNS